MVCFTFSPALPPPTMALSVLQEAGVITDDVIYRARQGDSSALVPSLFYNTQPQLHLAHLLDMLNDPQSWLFSMERYPPAGDPMDVEALGDMSDIPLQEVFANIYGRLPEDDELKMVPLPRPPFTPLDQEQILKNRFIQHIQIREKRTHSFVDHFWGCLTELLMHPRLLAPGQWHSVVEFQHRLWLFPTLKPMVLYMCERAELVHVFVMFRALNYAVRRYDLYADTTALVGTLCTWEPCKMLPRRRFQVFLAYFAASWNMWRWDEHEAYQLWRWVDDRSRSLPKPPLPPYTLRQAKCEIRWSARRIRPTISGVKRAFESSAELPRQRNKPSS
jgi:hypothetical protein